MSVVSKMALLTPPTLSQPYASVRSPSLPRRRLPPSSLSFFPGNQAKSIASLKFPYKPLFARGKSTASPSPACLLAGDGKPGPDNLGFPWESFEKATDGFKPSESFEKTVEEVLQEQMRNIRTRQFSAGGSGKNPPGGGGGQGGSGGGGDEGSFGVSDEALQVILATIGFVFMYVYVIHGLEINRLAKDFVKFLRTGTKSVRLNKFMEKWGSFLQLLLDAKEFCKSRLETEIVNAARRLNGVTNYKHRLRLQPTSNTEQ